MPPAKNNNGDAAASSSSTGGVQKKEKPKSTRKTSKSSADPNKMKRPVTAFLHFLADFRKQAGLTPGGVTAISKMAGQRWREMTTEEKLPYHKKQDQEKAIYQEAVLKMLTDKNDVSNAIAVHHDDYGVTAARAQK